MADVIPAGVKAGMTKCEWRAAGHPSGKLPLGHVKVEVLPPEPIKSAGFRIDESNVRRVQYSTSYRFDGTWNVSSFEPWGKPRGNRPYHAKSHPGLVAPDKIRFMNKFERPNKVQYDRRQQAIPDARGYLPGKDAETVFGLSRRDAQDVCCEMRPYNLNKHGRAQDESEVASVCSEFKNAPPVQPPTRRSFLQIQQGSDMKYSTNYGPFADQNKLNRVSSTYQNVRDHTIPPARPRSFAKIGEAALHFSGCIPGKVPESAVLGGTYAKVNQQARQGGILPGASVNLRTLEKAISGGQFYLPAHDAESVHRQRYVDARSDALSQRSYMQDKTAVSSEA